MTIWDRILKELGGMTGEKEVYGCKVRRVDYKVLAFCGGKIAPQERVPSLAPVFYVDDSGPLDHYYAANKVNSKRRADNPAVATEEDRNFEEAIERYNRLHP